MSDGGCEKDMSFDKWHSVSCKLHKKNRNISNEHSKSSHFLHLPINSCFAFQLFVSFPCLPCSALPVVLFLSSSFASSILPPPSSPSSKRGGTAKCPERVGFGSSRQSWLSSFPPEYLRYWDQATDCPTPCIGRCHHFTVFLTDLLVWRDGHEHGVIAHIGDVQTSHVPFLKTSSISYVILCLN